MSFALFGSCLIAERNDESGSGKQDKEWLFNKSETRAVFSRVLFLNPQVLSITSSVRLSIMIMEKFPSSILIVALNVFAIQLDNQQFYRHVLADELRNEPALLILDFLRNSLSFVTIPSSITTTLLKINILFKYPSDAFADKYSRVNILEFMLI
jgi:hypothetical protein